MLKSQIKSKFLLLNLEKKISLLSIVIHNLTVSARTYYSKNDNFAPIELYTFNEIIHCISSQLSHFISKENERYPDDVFIDILFESVNYRNTDCANDLDRAFNEAFSRTE